jgi:hypothetical protein
MPDEKSMDKFTVQFRTMTGCLQCCLLWADTLVIASCDDTLTAEQKLVVEEFRRFSLAIDKIKAIASVLAMTTNNGTEISTTAADLLHKSTCAVMAVSAGMSAKRGAYCERVLCDWVASTKRCSELREETISAIHETFRELRASVAIMNHAVFSSDDRLAAMRAAADADDVAWAQKHGVTYAEA